MKTNSIESHTVLQEWIMSITGKVVGWLDGRSGLYSKICGEKTTRRTVIRVNLITVAMVVGTLSVEKQPFVAIVAMICAGYLVHRLNGNDNKDEG